MTSVNLGFLLPAVPLCKSALHNSLFLANEDVAVVVIFSSLILLKLSEAFLSTIYSRNLVQLNYCFPVCSKSLLKERDIFFCLVDCFGGGDFGLFWLFVLFFFFSADEIRSRKYRKAEIVEKIALL